MLTKKIKTMLDVYQALPEGAPVQLINNRIVMSPAPNFPHFEIIDILITELKKLKIGRVLFAPVDVYLNNENVVQPDVFIIDDPKLIERNGVHGVPVLVVEVLSTQRRLDLIVKRDLYQKVGVKEYFVIDPDTRNVVGFYLNENHLFEQSAEKAILKSRLFKFEIAID